MTAAVLVPVLVGMFVGGVASGAVGFGIVLVSAPIVAIGAPHLLPSVFVAPSLAANLLVSHRERAHRDTALLRRLLVWQLPGVGVGLAVLSQVRDTETLALLVAGTVLVLVLVGISPFRPRRTRGTEAVAATIAGLSGALSATNGPPLAVLMADDDPGLLRATLPAYFVVSQLLLLAGWSVIGRAPGDALLTGLVAVPAAVAGAWFGQRVARRFLTRRMVRVTVLVLALTAAARAVLG